MAIFEISWSTSDFVEWKFSSQDQFMVKLFEFYSENESRNRISNLV